MMVTYEQLKHLYDEIGANATHILDEEWESTKTRFQKHVSRERIAHHEQVIQDFLRETFQPLVGVSPISTYLTDGGKPKKALKDFLAKIKPAMEQSHFQPFNLVGAHYRSVISVQGRRSAIAAAMSKLSERLRTFCPDQIDQFSDNSKLPLFIDFWQAVFLEQYFRVFEKPTTMNEWVLEVLPQKLKKKAGKTLEGQPIGVLVHFNASVTRCDRNHSAGHWIRIAFPEKFCAILITDELYKAFYGFVTGSVNKAIAQNPENVKKALMLSQDRGRPSPDQLYAWFELLRDANLRAWAGLERSGLVEICRRRCSNVTFQVLDQEPGFAKQLLGNFGPIMRTNRNHASEIGSDRFEAFEKTVRVFQAMLMYTKLYGDLYFTFPFFAGSGEPGCALTFMRDQSTEGNTLSEMNRCARELRQLGRDTIQNIMTHAKVCNNDISAGKFNTGNVKRILWPDGPAWEEVDGIWKTLQSDRGFASVFSEKKDWYRFILALAMNLASEKHEGKELAFSFLLGTPRNLIHDLKIEHEFLMQGSRLQLGPDVVNVLVSLSLIKGNYAFLQNPELALFISYPGFPLEITHIVRLGDSREGRGSRRALLREATKGKTSLLASASYGNGSADLIYNGNLMASYRAGTWRQSSSYQDFWRQLKHELQKIDTNNQMLIVLEKVIERISDEQGQGALFALGKIGAIEELQNISTPLTTVFDCVEGRTVEQVGESRLIQVAIQDGATLIDTDGGKISGRWLLRPVNPKAPVPAESNGGANSVVLENAWKQSGNSREWREWHKILKWGTRHMGALGASLKLGDDGIIIVISADGPVHVLKNGKAVQADGSDLVYGE